MYYIYIIYIYILVFEHVAIFYTVQHRTYVLLVGIWREKQEVGSGGVGIEMLVLLSRLGRRESIRSIGLREGKTETTANSKINEMWALGVIKTSSVYYYSTNYIGYFIVIESGG